MSELVRRTTGEVDPAEAMRLSKSKLMPEHIHKDPASVEYMMRIGAALGIDPTSAFQHIYVFESKGVLKASISAHLMAALTFAAGHDLHVVGDALQATATLIRKADEEKLRRYQVMREQERQQKLALLNDMQGLYGLQRQQILDRIGDLKELAALDEKPSDEEITLLRKQLTDLHGQYDFDALRTAVTETKFDLANILRFESVWTMKRARNISGLTDKSTWTDYGPEMLKSRAKSGVIRDGAIDVILGVRNFMANLGVEFSGDRDDELAMSNALYTPEELGVDVDESGAPLKGEFVDVTDERTNTRQAKLMDVARTIVGKGGGDALLDWAEKTADRSDTSKEDKISRLEAVLAAAREAGKADELVPRGDQEKPLSVQLENVISNIQEHENERGTTP